MINFLKIRAYQIYYLVISLFILGSVYLMWATGWIKNFPEADDAFIEPLGVFSLFSIGISAFLLLWPPYVFMGWLKYLASWGLVLAFFVIIGTETSTGIMGIDRQGIVIMTMTVFSFVSFVFVVTYWLSTRKNHRQP